MLVQIELTPAQAQALAKLEKETGESLSSLIDRALEQYLQYKAEEAELLADIEQARADIAAGRVHSSAEVMASAMAAITRAKARKSAK